MPLFNYYVYILNNIVITHLVTFSNAETKVKLLKANKSNSVIYRLNNTITGKRYRGSYKNLLARFNDYYSLVNIENRVKKGYSNLYKNKFYFYNVKYN